MIYEPAEEITIIKSIGNSISYKCSHFSDLCYCFETPEILKICYRGVSTIIFKTFYLGRNSTISVTIKRKSITKKEADRLPKSLRFFGRLTSIPNFFKEEE